MKCPYCASEMIQGTLRSRGSNYFLPDGEKTPAWYTERSMSKKNAILLPPSPYNAAFPRNWPVAHICKACRKMILSYS